MLLYAFPCASIDRAPDATVAEADPMPPEISVLASPSVLNASSEAPPMVSITFILILMVRHG